MDKPLMDVFLRNVMASYDETDISGDVFKVVFGIIWQM